MIDNIYEAVKQHIKDTIGDPRDTFGPEETDHFYKGLREVISSEVMRAMKPGSIKLVQEQPQVLFGDTRVYLVPPLPGAADLAQRLAEAKPGDFLPLTHDEMAIALEILPWPSHTGLR